MSEQEFGDHYSLRDIRDNAAVKLAHLFNWSQIALRCDLTCDQAQEIAVFLSRWDSDEKARKFLKHHHLKKGCKPGNDCYSVHIPPYVVIATDIEEQDQ